MIRYELVVFSSIFSASAHAHNKQNQHQDEAKWQADNWNLPENHEAAIALKHLRYQGYQYRNHRKTNNTYGHVGEYFFNAARVGFWPAVAISRHPLRIPETESQTRL
ncbi:MAG: hypothetical protein RL174_618 [Actinomycetota bacterium]